MTTIEHLEDRIWRLQNSFGNSALEDALAMQKIAELERQIAADLLSMQAAQEQRDWDAVKRFADN